MYKLDYYKQLIDVVITYKNCNKYDLDEIILMLQHVFPSVVRVSFPILTIIIKILYFPQKSYNFPKMLLASHKILLFKHILICSPQKYGCGSKNMII